MGIAAEAYAHIAQALKFDCYADVPTAATPLTAVLAFMTGVPMISPRFEKKEHGTGSSIDGSFRQGQVALLVDDLITRAESKLEAIAVLENNGVLVRDVIVLVDREQGGVRELNERGYGCWPVLQLGSMLTFYKNEGMITDEQFTRTDNYLALTNKGV
jgi:orotate phosphoribosyltransferase